MKSHSMGIQLGGILGIIGLFAMGANTWVGLGMISVAAAIVILSIWTPKPPNTNKVERHSPVRISHQVTSIAKQAERVNPKSLSLLKRTLYQANLDPKAVVINKDKMILTVQDILVKLIQVAETHRIAVPEVAKVITKIYKRIFENLERAVAQYPEDSDRLALWLANQSLMDVRKELEAK